MTSSIIHLAAAIGTVANVLEAAWEPRMAPAQAVERGDLVGLTFGVSIPSHSTAVLTLDLGPPDFYKK